MTTRAGPWTEKQAVREALCRWDPIGVGELQAPEGEYDAYVGDVYRLLVGGATELELFEYLWGLETGPMGLSGDRERTLAAARELAALREEDG